MANGLLYYRTMTTQDDDDDGGGTSYSDPQNLPSGQKLEFTFPTDLLESINEVYSNNIKRSPIPNQDGTRKVNVQENGLESYTITINGVFKKAPEAGISTIRNMRKIKQVDAHHIYGIFGLEVDNAPQYNIDPTNLKGLHIISTTIGYKSPQVARYDFQIQLGFGGTL